MPMKNETRKKTRSLSLCRHPQRKGPFEVPHHQNKSRTTLAAPTAEPKPPGTERNICLSSALMTTTTTTEVYQLSVTKKRTNEKFKYSDEPRPGSRIDRRSAGGIFRSVRRRPTGAKRDKAICHCWVESEEKPHQSSSSSSQPGGVEQRRNS